mgnify:CR=1 FL=1
MKEKLNTTKSFTIYVFIVDCLTTILGNFSYNIIFSLAECINIFAFNMLKKQTGYERIEVSCTKTENRIINN